MQTSKYEKKSILIDMREDGGTVAYVYAQALNEKDLNYALQMLNEGLRTPLKSENKYAQE